MNFLVPIFEVQDIGQKDRQTQVQNETFVTDDSPRIKKKTTQLVSPYEKIRNINTNADTVTYFYINSIIIISYNIRSSSFSINCEILQLQRKSLCN